MAVLNRCIPVIMIGTLAAASANAFYGPTDREEFNQSRWMVYEASRVNQDGSDLSRYGKGEPSRYIMFVSENRYGLPISISTASGLYTTEEAYRLAVPRGWTIKWDSNVDRSRTVVLRGSQIWTEAISQVNSYDNLRAEVDWYKKSILVTKRM